ncbi:4Fe-4S dicluster domain-containing protein [Methanobacterium alkalithermotolerans]|uniref:4Fe-4S dicluster domain-containing protein n=1 Tax=Methanobacterium alkalithermotolerans TaxID=2731220 RepID=A0A8T8K7B1_9EURY|nr:4Fe-4S dicluster domain-containing protein [Methanobacterium alkalithermotolerans]QUH23712.1 4Fe-4S dicluster domain-containing protein [Methanobacterium alkalithermotolerans]RJS49720.1 MAG: formate hydrogenlyase [Methanobacterium sp.]
MKELVSRPELCNECMKCERNCPQNAIRVINGVPIFCMHCAPEKAPCLNICPEEAITEADGAIVILEDKCIGCGLCRDACPIGAVTMDEKGIASKCDLCIDLEEPCCVLSCPTKALLVDSEKIISEKREKITQELERLKGIMKH